MAVRLALWLALALWAGLTAARAGAQEVAAVPVAVPGWEFDVGPYFWVFESTGEVTVGSIKAPVDVGMDDVANLAAKAEAYGGMARVEARRGRFTLMADTLVGAVRTEQTGRLTTLALPATMKTQSRGDLALVEFGLAYRVGEWPISMAGRGITFDLMAGARYQRLAKGARMRQGAWRTEMSESDDWFDPFVGARWEVDLMPNFVMGGQGDAGGFGQGSDLAWSFVGALRYQLPVCIGPARPWLSAGYKMLEFDRTEGPNGRDNLFMKGPLLGVGLRF